MSVRGWVTKCNIEPRGSELTADVTAGATTLPVEWTGPYDDQGGTLELNGERLTYTAVDDDASTLTVAVGPAANALVDDRVAVVDGGQIVDASILKVTLGVGDDIEVIVPFGDRDLWPEGEYDDPVPVILSDDLERIEEVPGRTPSRSQVFGHAPGVQGAAFANTTLATSTWTNIDNWFTFREDQMVHNFDRFDIQVDGLYDIRAGATFAANATGLRYLRIRKYLVTGGTIDGRPTKASAEPSGVTIVDLAQYHRLHAGESVAIQGFQNSGAGLDVRGGDFIGSPPPETEVAILWVQPL